MRAVFDGRYASSSEWMKTVMNRDRLGCTMGFVGGSTRRPATRIWHGIRSRLRRREWPTALALTFSTRSVARQRCPYDGPEDARISQSRIREKPDGDRNHYISHSFITLLERELLLPRSLTKHLVNHTRPCCDLTEGYAADPPVEQLREPAQHIAARVDKMMNGGSTGNSTVADGTPPFLCA